MLRTDGHTPEEIAEMIIAYAHTGKIMKAILEGATLMTGGSVRRQIVRFALPIFWGKPVPAAL